MPSPKTQEKTAREKNEKNRRRMQQEASGTLNAPVRRGDFEELRGEVFRLKNEIGELRNAMSTLKRALEMKRLISDQDLWTAMRTALKEEAERRLTGMKAAGFTQEKMIAHCMEMGIAPQMFEHIIGPLPKAEEEKK